MELRHAGLLDGTELLDHFNATTGSTATECLDGLDPDEREQVAAMVERTSAAAAEGWQIAKTGVAPVQQPQMPLGQWSGLDGDEVDRSDRGNGSAFTAALREAEGGDSSRSCGGISHLQRELCLLMDNTKLRRLLERLRLQGDDGALRRLDELRNGKTCHSWPACWICGKCMDITVAHALC